ncbi:MAG: hypothetical protein MSH30_01245 [Campylobacter sp.]|uniref:hypothetical protein n=1 Tax=Campylobacter sp. TaxID=205 RepID=UPI002A880591|nr:hypothetical protein [Campylobacter sp.]MCI6344179.1 hypothetical protein [Campylobacter sp.]MCI6694586.1 hypothetical protein [Campylobacter sp.]MCI6819214.1 hypothetical protein [Campylobacter sp.]MCI7361949.1 hypothetical protein [Campylobacter sp.]MCI7464403.1 hypothetical protein [Campylobacter sp.]
MKKLKIIVLSVFFFASASVAQWVDTDVKLKNQPIKSQEYGNYWDESRREIPRFKKRDLDFEKMLGKENEHYERAYKENEYKKTGKGRIKMH